MKTKEFEFYGAVMTFETERWNVMVNATEMVNILRNEGTQLFIIAALNTANSQYLNIKKVEDLDRTKKIIKLGFPSILFVNSKKLPIFVMLNDIK